MNDGIELLVNSPKIGLNEFTSSFLKNTIERMIFSLKRDVGSLYEPDIEIANMKPDDMKNAVIKLFIKRCSY